MKDLTQWPPVPFPEEGEILLDPDEIPANAIQMIRRYSEEAASHCENVAPELDDEAAVELMIEIYKHTAKLINIATGLRPVFQFRMNPVTGDSLQTRVFCYQTVH